MSQNKWRNTIILIAERTSRLFGGPLECLDIVFDFVCHSILQCSTRPGASIPIQGRRRLRPVIIRGGRKNKEVHIFIIPC